jgi:hypothetical protein
MKTILLMITLLGLFQKSNAQVTNTNLHIGITDFISWLDTLDRHEIEVFKIQNKNKVVRQLGYIASDLDYLALEKRALAETVIEQHSLGENLISITYLNEFKESINKLMLNISNLIFLLNSEYQAEGNEILQKIKHDLNSKKEIELLEIVGLITDNHDFKEERLRESTERASLLIFRARDKVLELRKSLLAQ